MPLTQASGSTDERWQTHYTVSELVNPGQPEPREIFKIHYRVLNGTIDKFQVPFYQTFHYVETDIITSAKEDNGILEIRFPKNYPTANVEGGGEAGFAFMDRNATGLFYSKYDIIVEQLEGDECFYEYSIQFPDNGVVLMLWSEYFQSEPYRGVDVPESCLHETLVQDVVRTADGIIAPLHQIKAGVKANEVICPEEFALVLHPNGLPYCVTPSSFDALKERWSIW